MIVILVFSNWYVLRRIIFIINEQRFLRLTVSIAAFFGYREALLSQVVLWLWYLFSKTFFLLVEQQEHGSDTPPYRFTVHAAAIVKLVGKTTHYYRHTKRAKQLPQDDKYSSGNYHQPTKTKTSSRGTRSDDVLAKKKCRTLVKWYLLGVWEIWISRCYSRYLSDGKNSYQFAFPWSLRWRSIKLVTHGWRYWSSGILAQKAKNVLSKPFSNCKSIIYYQNEINHLRGHFFHNI